MKEGTWDHLCLQLGGITLQLEPPVLATWGRMLSTLDPLQRGNARQEDTPGLKPRTLPKPSYPSLKPLETIVSTPEASEIHQVSKPQVWPSYSGGAGGWIELQVSCSQGQGNQFS